jgi:hypothetical protein
MTDDPARADALGTTLCEVCTQPMPAGAQPLRVGACEFPFNVHEECAERLGPVAAEVAQMCAWADEQPDGLLWLGSWDPLAQGEAGPEQGSVQTPEQP